MRISQIEFNNHPILNNLKIDFKKTNGDIYANIIFVGENGCGKTTLLNELFNYDSSQYIINKEQNYNICGECPHIGLFIAQDLKYRNAINSVMNKISGAKIYNDITEAKNNNYLSSNVMSLNKNNKLNTPYLLKESIKEFNNDRIEDYLSNNSNKIMDDVSQLIGIDGNINQTKIDTFSSGEQELILRLESLKNRISQNLDMLLLDEPETSLHPKWQLKFIPYILNVLKDNNSGKRDLQLFVSSHSENVLKSVFKLEDTLIVRLYKEKNEIKCQKITNMDTRLSKTTIDEIQYLIFDILSIEYHNQLYGYLLAQYNTQKKLDEYFYEVYKQNINLIQNKYNYSRDNNIETLPTYIRNATSHSENTDRHYTDSDLKKSIEIMRSVINIFTKSGSTYC